MINSIDLAPFKNPICLALDVDSPELARPFIQKLGHLVGGIKVGPRLVLNSSTQFLKEIAEVSPLFIDLKHFDIPSTMAAAVEASFHTGASVVTVHALSGLKALSEVAKIEKKLNQIRPFRVLAVTMLTSWEETDLSNNFIDASIGEHVKMCANLVLQSGLTSVVCSAHELEFLKPKGLFCLTPGIRYDVTGTSDQKRVMTPAEALKAGSNALVIGRPLLADTDPEGTVRRILSGVI